MDCPGGCGSRGTVPAGYRYCRPCTFSPDGPPQREARAQMLAELGPEGYEASLEAFRAWALELWGAEKLAEMKAATARSLELMTLERDHPEQAARRELEEMGFAVTSDDAPPLRKT